MTGSSDWVDDAVEYAPATDLPVGSAVRIVIAQDQMCPECPHFTSETGRTGRVLSVRATKNAPSHPYLVMLDKTPSGDVHVDWRLAIIARHYAANELEMIA